MSHDHSDDDILCGFRKDAGLPAPGKTLGGWCARDSSTVFGQWLSYADIEHPPDFETNSAFRRR